MSNTLTWEAAARARPLRAKLLYLLAAALRAAGDLANSRAHALSETRHEIVMAGTVEFHALHSESGAPEGALYIDGVLVGVIEGVTRL
jgi:hypothetical protein